MPTLRSNLRSEYNADFAHGKAEPNSPPHFVNGVYGSQVISDVHKAKQELGAHIRPCICSCLNSGLPTRW